MSEPLLGIFTFTLIVLFSQVLPRIKSIANTRAGSVLSLFPLLLAIVVAWLVAGALSLAGFFVQGDAGYADLAKLEAADWVYLPYPLQWGTPVFDASAIVGMLAGVFCVVVESIGDYYSVSRIIGIKPPNTRTISLGIAVEGIGTLLAGLLGTGNGTTSYSENEAAIAITRVGSRRVIQVAALFMLISGVLAKVGGLVSSLPQPIVGSVYCAAFG
jgi:nucleobase transporter 1/2